MNTHYIPNTLKMIPVAVIISAGVALAQKAKTVDEFTTIAKGYTKLENAMQRISEGHEGKYSLNEFMASHPGLGICAFNQGETGESSDPYKAVQLAFYDNKTKKTYILQVYGSDGEGHYAKESSKYIVTKTFKTDKIIQIYNGNQLDELCKYGDYINSDIVNGLDKTLEKELELTIRDNEEPTGIKWTKKNTEYKQEYEDLQEGVFFAKDRLRYSGLHPASKEIRSELNGLYSNIINKMKTTVEKYENTLRQQAKSAIQNDKDRIIPNKNRQRDIINKTKKTIRSYKR
ncbi:MAG: hypothetical protein WC916_05095 [Candidatus Woesearchaeota archaeon]